MVSPVEENKIPEGWTDYVGKVTVGDMNATETVAQALLADSDESDNDSHTKSGVEWPRHRQRLRERQAYRKH